MDSAHNDELDKRLKRLITSAQNYPPGSEARRLALRKLVEEIQRQSRRLVRPSGSKYPSNLCAEIFEVARQRLLVFVYHPDTNVDGYNSEIGAVLVWLNVKLARRFFDEAKEQLIDSRVISFTESSARASGGRRIEDVADPSEMTGLFEIVKQCIEEDNEGVFEKEHIRHHPAANFKAIVLERFAGKSWTEIAAELGIQQYGTITSFYHRSLKKFAPIIKNYVQQ